VTAFLDASLLAHALLPHQLTDEAVRAIDNAKQSGEELLVWDCHLVELLSVIRKFRNRGAFDHERAAETAQRALGFGLDVVSASMTSLERGFDLASRLGQPDTFDSTGYVLARELDADFWVSDRRFANAAVSAGLPGIRYVA